MGLYYISKWATEEAAQEFAKIYAAALPKRYSSVHRIPIDTAIPGRDAYASSDGPILIQQSGNMVIAVESFDETRRRG